MTLPNIALTGKFRAGKDQVARYLTEKYGYTRFAFGDELKRYAHELFGGSNAKQRELYQWFGQTMRQRDPDIWVRKCFENITAVEESKYRRAYSVVNVETGETVLDVPADPLRAVITDVRQPNEFDRCRDEGYVIIRVTAPDSLRIERARSAGDKFDAKTLDHETERCVDGFDVDYEIENSGTVDDLYVLVDSLMEEVAANGSA